MLSNSQIGKKFHTIYKNLLQYNNSAVKYAKVVYTLEDYTKKCNNLLSNSNITSELSHNFKQSLKNLQDYVYSMKGTTDDEINLIIKNCIYIGSYFTGNVSHDILPINSSLNDPRDEAFDILNKKFNLVGKPHIYAIYLKKDTQNKTYAEIYFKVIKNHETEFIDTNKIHEILMGNIGMYGMTLTPYSEDIMSRFLVATHNKFISRLFSNFGGKPPFDIKDIFTKSAFIRKAVNTRMVGIAKELDKKVSYTDDNHHYFNHDELMVLLDTLLNHFSMPYQYMRENFRLIWAILNWCRKTSYSNKEYESFDTIKNFAIDEYNAYVNKVNGVDLDSTVGNESVILEPNRQRFLTVTYYYLDYLLKGGQPGFKGDYFGTFNLIKKIKVAKGGFIKGTAHFSTITFSFYELRTLLNSFILIGRITDKNSVDYRIEESYIKFFIKANLKTINPSKIDDIKTLKQIGKIYGMSL